MMRAAVCARALASRPGRALAAGADGLIIEIHPDPDRAKSDGGQSLTLENFAALMPRLAAVAHTLGRKMG